MNQAHPFLAGELWHRLATGNSVGNTAFEKGVVDDCLRIEAPDARADLRFRAPGGTGEDTAVGIEHVNGVAGFGPPVEAGDRAFKDPRMAAIERAFLARLENEFCHGSYFTPGWPQESSMLCPKDFVAEGVGQLDQLYVMRQDESPRL